MQDLEHFKDKENVNNISEYDVVANEILNELNKYESRFETLADITPREKETNRGECGGFKNESDDSEKTTERRFCKCLYYTNTKNKVKTNCETCNLRNRQAEGYHAKLAGNFEVIYYEFVPTDKGKGVGNVDLILADENFAYLTEVKPPHGNSETLLRMFLEIETYSRVTASGNQYKKIVGSKPLRKAILFFKHSPQYKDFISENRGISTKKLLSIFGISVLCVEFKNGEVHISAIG